MAENGKRLQSLDALRGFCMFFKRKGVFLKT